MALIAARVKPTALVFFLAVAFGQDSLVENPTMNLALAAVLAVAGLGMAILHQHDTRPNQVASAVALVPMAAPAAAACWLADRPFSAIVCGVLAVLYGVCGLLPGRFSPVLRSAAIPIGGLFAGFALLRLTDGEYAGSISFGLAVAYLMLATRTRFMPVLVVGLVAAGIGTLRWLPLLAGHAPSGLGRRPRHRSSGPVAAGTGHGRRGGTGPAHVRRTPSPSHGRDLASLGDLRLGGHRARSGRRSGGCWAGRRPASRRPTRS